MQSNNSGHGRAVSHDGRQPQLSGGKHHERSLTLVTRFEERTPPAPGSGAPLNIVACRESNSQLGGKSGDTTSSQGSFFAGGFGSEPLACCDRHGLDGTGQFAKLKSPQQRVEGQLILSAAYGPCFPVDQPDARFWIVEYGVDRPPKGDTVRWFDFEEDLSSLETFDRKALETVIEVTNLADQPGQLAGLQPQRCDLGVHGSPNLLPAYLIDLIVPDGTIHEMPGKNTVGKTTPKRRTRLRRILTSQPPERLLGAFQVRRVERRGTERASPGVTSGNEITDRSYLDAREPRYRRETVQSRCAAIRGSSRMSTKLRVLLFTIPVVLLAVPVVAFAFSEAVARGEIEPEVSAADIDLSGLGRDDALAAVRAYETELRATPVMFTVKDTAFTLSPVTVGLDIDEESIVDKALDVRREGGVVSRFFDWLKSSREYPPVAIPVDLIIDDTRLDSVFDAWEQGAIAVPPYEGNIIITGGRIVPEYPRQGEGIDRDVAMALAAAAMVTPNRSIVDLPTNSSTLNSHRRISTRGSRKQASTSTGR